MSSQIPTATEPYLSIVVPSRNDNHGGDLLKRMQIFVTGLLEQCRRHQIPSELIIVEWNPPADRPPLVEVLQWPAEPGPCAVRIIEVSAEMHRRYENHKGLAVYQMIAKNVGIRRARGRFVLATNIDLLFSDELMQFIGAQQLRSGQMYRIDRHDVMPNVPDAPVQQQLAWCQSHLLRVNALRGTFSTTPDGALALEGNDIASQRDGILLGAGWFSRELAGDRPFRWFDNDAEINIEPDSGSDRTLAIDIEPGPGLSWKPTTLDVIDQNNSKVFSRALTTRVVVNILVPKGQRCFWRLRASGGGYHLAADPRPLNARVRRCRVYKPNAITTLSTSFRNTLLKLYRRLRDRRRPPSEFLGKFPDFLHLTACGDFTLLAREHWIDLRGYPEFDMFAMNLDSLFCWSAHYSGAKEKVLTSPMRAYHIEHEVGSGWTPEGHAKLYERMKENRVPWLELPNIIRWAYDMASFGTPIIFNRQDWGFGSEDLKETVVRESVIAAQRPA